MKLTVERSVLSRIDELSMTSHFRAKTARGLENRIYIETYSK